MASWRGRHIFRTRPHSSWATEGTSAALGSQAFGLQHRDGSNPFLFVREAMQGKGLAPGPETDLVAGETQPTLSQAHALYFGKEGKGFVAS